MESTKIKRIVAWYNMIPNIFWSALNLIPISVFCYSIMTLSLFFSILIPCLFCSLLPNSFFDKIQLSKISAVYKAIGIRVINKFAQNGEVLNQLIRKKNPSYKVITTRTGSIDQLIRTTYIFEKFHFILFVFFTVTTIYALIQNHTMWALTIFFNNIIYNIYPNLLQQYIRIRLNSAKVK